MGSAQVILVTVAMILASTLALSSLNGDAGRVEAITTFEVLTDANALARELQRQHAERGTYDGAVVPSRTLFATFTVTTRDSVATVGIESTFLRGTMTVSPHGVSLTRTETFP